MDEQVDRLVAERDRAREDCGHQKAMRAHAEEERDLFIKRYRDASDRCVRLAATVERVRAAVATWQAELDSGSIRDKDARYCWGLAVTEARAALEGDET